MSNVNYNFWIFRVFGILLWCFTAIKLFFPALLMIILTWVFTKDEELVANCFLKPIAIFVIALYFLLATDGETPVFNIHYKLKSPADYFRLLKKIYSIIDKNNRA